MNHNTHISPANLAAINANRRTDGKFGSWQAGEAPTPDIAAAKFTSISDDEFDTDFRPIDSPSGSNLWTREEVQQARAAGAITDNQVWTSGQDDDGNFVTTSGFTTMQGDGYVVTEVEWDHDMEAVEYRPDDDNFYADDEFDTTPANAVISYGGDSTEVVLHPVLDHLARDQFDRPWNVEIVHGFDSPRKVTGELVSYEDRVATIRTLTEVYFGEPVDEITVKVEDIVHLNIP